MDIPSLIQKAKEAAHKAHAPYSGFKVGAALLTKGGKVYTGCNIESSTFSLTLCAERVALFKALSEGEREFSQLTIVTDSEELTPPCGACRQLLWDFAPDIDIILADPLGHHKIVALKDLFPRAFEERYFVKGKRDRKDE